MKQLKRIYIYCMLLMSFAIALFPIGSHLEMCSSKDGHCHLVLNFCGIEVGHKNNEENYSSTSDHTTCESSAMFHNTELVSVISANHKASQFNIALTAVFSNDTKLNVRPLNYNYKDYIEHSVPQYLQIVRSTILVI